MRNATFLDKNEHFVLIVDATHASSKRSVKGKLALTTKRLFFAQIRGIFSKQAAIRLTIPYEDIVSVSTHRWLLLWNKIVLTIKHGHQTSEIVFIKIPDSEKLVERIKELIHQVNNEKKIETTVVIKEKADETPLETLKKKLARGEITTTEFHKRVQRI
ncbi:TPA: hypothetical protein HA244_01770 [Candidatus Micrarchaeota archaeon]|nr:hypothetical protein [Candidatus Micrarchaeota archaeon]